MTAKSAKAEPTADNNYLKPYNILDWEDCKTKSPSTARKSKTKSPSTKKKKCKRTKAKKKKPAAEGGGAGGGGKLAEPGTAANPQPFEPVPAPAVRQHFKTLCLFFFPGPHR